MKRRALVTVSDEFYLLGTQVLFYSFLKHHPNFEGDLIVIHDHLKPKNKKYLTKKFNVQFEQVSSELTEKLNDLVNVCPHLANKIKRFYSLEMFRLKSYEQIIFLDSDVLCIGNCSYLFDMTQKIAAAPDLTFYYAEARDKTTFRAVKKIDKKSFLKTFNAGVIVYNFENNISNDYKHLIGMLSPEVFTKVTSGHTDQFLLNSYFEESVSWLDTHYNYLIRENRVIINELNLKPEEAKLIHYIRHPKPWNFKQFIKDKMKRREKVEYFNLWYEAYKEMLSNEKNSSGKRWLTLNLFRIYKVFKF